MNKPILTEEEKKEAQKVVFKSDGKKRKRGIRVMVDGKVLYEDKHAKKASGYGNY